MTKRKHTGTSRSASQSSGAGKPTKAADDLRKVLEKYGNVVFLTKEESEFLRENTELDGCIARPKTPDA